MGRSFTLFEKHVLFHLGDTTHLFRNKRTASSFECIVKSCCDSSSHQFNPLQLISKLQLSSQARCYFNDVTGTNVFALYSVNSCLQTEAMAWERKLTPIPCYGADLNPQQVLFALSFPEIITISNSVSVVSLSLLFLQSDPQCQFSHYAQENRR